MITAIYIDGNSDCKDAFYVREEVFVKGQNIDKNLVFDDLDEHAIHVVVYEDSKPVGCGRLINSSDEYLIGRIGVLEHKRGNYYGDLIVRMLIQKAFDIGAQEISVHSQLPAVKFYNKIGFKEYGDIYKEASMDHINMKLIKENLRKNCNKK
ncbi:MAG: GNAT family N-acetyltransferase [Vallitalea sp.]|jgi:predicted GNAT family N-acyltransferase|nr:GNAT family N-acetyltransferase [Vallitalea sp.]